MNVNVVPQQSFYESILFPLIPGKLEAMVTDEKFKGLFETYKKTLSPQVASMFDVILNPVYISTERIKFYRGSALTIVALAITLFVTYKVWIEKKPDSTPDQANHNTENRTTQTALDSIRSFSWGVAGGSVCGGCGGVTFAIGTFTFLAFRELSAVNHWAFLIKNIYPKS